ncbi:MAG TPA: hypothetical protein DCW90_16125 [Lachnospiraceae bacterium]|nr:hypothetical protein [Lachnospiraceae bacterium]
METNALSVANYFIELAQKEEQPIRLLGLVKRVYIAHGFALAILGHGLLNPRFDKVEAWKYGPVIPSVYHSFKQYKSDPIQSKSVVLELDENGEEIFPTPTLKNKEEMAIVEMVWKRYKSFSGSELVSLTHMKGTPWQLCFKPGENIEIPDELTKAYYCRVVDIVKRKYEQVPT